MKKHNVLLIIIILSLFSGCTKVKIKPEFSKLEKRTQTSTGSSIVLDTALHYDICDIPHAGDTIEHGMSKHRAVSIALQNNPELQADFQNLGIAKADLVQAGLYTNPSINSVFRFPTREPSQGTGQTNIECITAFRLSDLWQVPLSKHVAEDVLEIVSLHIFSTILTTAAETKMAYDTCLRAELQLQNTKSLLETTQELRDEIYYRQHYGYTSDFDKDLIDAQVSMLEAELQQRKADLFTAYIHLKKLMGLAPSSTPIKLTDTLYNELPIPEFDSMEEYALAHRPEMQIASMKIKQYTDMIRLEKSKIFKDIDIGLGYKQDFEKPFRGWGPYFDMKLPLFDDNYAQIARAEFLLKQAEQEVVAQRIKILEELHRPYTYLKELKKQIALYTQVILPSHQKAIDYAYTYVATMQINMVTALESTIKWHTAHAQLIDAHYQAMKEIAQLERAVGKNFNLFIEDDNQTSREISIC